VFNDHAFYSSTNEHFNFVNGKIETLGSTSAPEILNRVETWEEGDKIYYDKSYNNKSGKICTSPGTSGIPVNVTGTGTGNIINVNDVSQFLKGDWIEISGVSDYHRIASIDVNALKLTLEGSISVSTPAAITFHAPVWIDFD